MSPADNLAITVPTPGSRWRHLKTDRVYVVEGFATMQISGALDDVPSWDGATAVLYRTDGGGAGYVRPIGQFLQRFEVVDG